MRTLQIRLPLLLLGGLLLPGAASAADHRPRCTAAIAQATSVEAIQAAITSWEGHCVRISGLGTARRLYANREALVDRIPYDEAPTARSIVIKWEGHHPPLRRPHQIELIGTVGRCITENALVNGWQAQHPDQMIMLAGLCHTSLANYVRPVSIRVLSNRPIPRLTELEVPPERRELVEAPENVPGHAQAIEAARAMLASIQSRNEAAFARFEDPMSVDNDETRTDFRRATASASVFAALPPGSAHQERTFLDWGERDDILANPDRNDQPALITCWCRTSNCSGRWPVRALDADNDPSRPYACIATNDYIIYPRGHAIQATAKIEPNGFTEP